MNTNTLQHEREHQRELDREAARSGGRRPEIYCTTCNLVQAHFRPGSSVLLNGRWFNRETDQSYACCECNTERSI